MCGRGRLFARPRRRHATASDPPVPNGWLSPRCPPSRDGTTTADGSETTTADGSETTTADGSETTTADGFETTTADGSETTDTGGETHTPVP